MQSLSSVLPKKKSCMFVTIPVDGKTYLLWFGPFGLLIGGGILLWIMNRRRVAGVQPVAPVSGEVLARGNAMLKDE